MSHAYVVTSGEYSGYGIIGVFSEMGKAQRFCIDLIHEGALAAMAKAREKNDDEPLCRYFLPSGPITIEVYEQDRDDSFPGEDRVFQMFPQPKEAAENR